MLSHSMRSTLTREDVYDACAYVCVYLVVREYLCVCVYMYVYVNNLYIHNPTKLEQPDSDVQYICKCIFVLHVFKHMST